MILRVCHEMIYTESGRQHTGWVTQREHANAGFPGMQARTLRQRACSRRIFAWIDEHDELMMTKVGLNWALFQAICFSLLPLI